MNNNIGVLSWNIAWENTKSIIGDNRYRRKDGDLMNTPGTYPQEKYIVDWVIDRVVEKITHRDNLHLIAIQEMVEPAVEKLVIELNKTHPKYKCVKYQSGNDLKKQETISSFYDSSKFKKIESHLHEFSSGRPILCLLLEDLKDIGKNILFINVHYPHKDYKSDSFCLDKINKAIKKIAGYYDRVIIAGDCNRLLNELIIIGKNNKEYKCKNVNPDTTRPSCCNTMILRTGPKQIDNKKFTDPKDYLSTGETVDTIFDSYSDTAHKFYIGGFDKNDVNNSKYIDARNNTKLLLTASDHISIYALLKSSNGSSIPNSIKAISKEQLENSQFNFKKIVKMMTNQKHKTGHWIWWIWPTMKQVRRTTQEDYSLNGLDDLHYYLLDKTLNDNLQEITRVTSNIPTFGSDINELIKIFGIGPNTYKFKQSMFIYLIGCSDLILKNITLTSDKIHGLIDTFRLCYNVLVKMGVTDFFGILNGDGDKDKNDNNYFMKKLQKLDFHKDVKELINTSQKLDVLKDIIDRPRPTGVGRPRPTRPTRVGRDLSGRNPFQYPSNKFTLILKGNLGEINDHNVFKNKCIEDIHKFLDIKLERVVIKEPLQSGSIKVYVEIINRPKDPIITEIDIKDLLNNQLIHDRVIIALHITRNPVLTIPERRLLDKHNDKQFDNEINIIHLKIGEQSNFNIKDIKTVVSKKSNDYVFAYNLNISGLEEINYKEKLIVLDRFLNR